MSSPKKLAMTARGLRILLCISTLLVAAGGVISFYFALGELKKYAVEVSHKKVDAEASKGTIQALEKVKQELEDTKDVTEKMNMLKSTSRFPEFRVVDSVKAIADRNHIGITSFSYPGTAAGQGTTAPSSPAKPASPTKSGASKDTIALAVTLSPSVNYENLLQFIYDIEQNLPKMTVEGVSLVKDSAGKITSEPITVRMYVNQE